MTTRKKKRWLALGAAGLLLAALGSCFGFRSMMASKIPPPATDATGQGKLPVVVLAVRGRVEVLDPGTQQWSRLTPGMVLHEGMVVSTSEGADVTLFSSGNFSMTASDQAVFEIGRARRRGDSADVAIKLRSGRVATRVSARGGDTRLSIATEFGTYSVNGGTAAVGTGLHGDQVVVGTGRVDAQLADGSYRELGANSQVAFGAAADGSVNQSDLTGSTDVSQALAVHLNTVGNTTGEAAGDLIDLEAERRRVQDLIYWGMEQLRGRQFGELIAQLSNDFSIQGIPTSPSNFGAVVSDFNAVHQQLTSTPDPQVSVTLDTGGATASTTTDSSGTTTTIPPTTTSGTDTTTSGGTTAPPTDSGGTTSPTGDTTTTTTTTTGGNDLTATATVTSAIVATEQEPAPSTEQPPPPPTCVLSAQIKYVFKLKYVDGVWKIVSLEVMVTQ